MIGKGVASGVLLFRNFTRGPVNAWQAGRSGLNRQSAWETAGDTVSIVSDIASTIAPLRVASDSLRAASGATDDAALKGNLLKLERSMGT